MTHPGSLRWKFMRVVMAATGAALLLSAVAMLVYEVHVQRGTWMNDLASQAALLDSAVAPALEFDDAQAAQAALAPLRIRPQIELAALYDLDQHLFASYRSASSTDLRIPQQPGAHGYRFDGDHLELFRPVVQHGEVLGTLYLRGQHDLSARIVGYLWILAFCMGIGLTVAWVVFSRLHPTLTRPLLEMAEAAERVRRRDFGVRVTGRSDGEVGMLVDNFNAMLDDLAAEMAERRRAEDALRAADRRKDEFLATLAHELRNPLSPLSNALVLLERADDNPKVRASARAMMGRQLAHLVRLIDDLLEISRITTGKLDLRCERLDVVAVVKSALEDAGPALQARGHAVDVALPAGPVWVHADPTRLIQVFVNLLHNAARYTEPGGHVRVAMRAGAQVTVTVEDDGIGIEAAQLPAIFEMFEQVDKSYERGAAGLGIGLTIARRLVELHGGSLQAYSAGLGQGSRFTVTLPTVDAPAAAAPDANGVAAADGRGMAVLIADDNVDFAASLASLLELEGHAVRVVHDGRAALEAALAAPPAVAFLDIGMPAMNGYDLARALRATAATRDVVLVAVTGWGQDSDRQRVRDAGFDHHLVKPVDMRRVLALLQAVGDKASATPAR